MGTAALTLSQYHKGLKACFLSWWQRSKRRRTCRPLRVEQSVGITNKTTVTVISVYGEQLLMGVTNGCIQFYRLNEGQPAKLRIEGVVR